MNQILITEKLYVTPELRKKKKVYRLEFVISIFFVCLLFSYYIYAEYDKNKSEEVSKSILANTVVEEKKEDDTVVKTKNNVLVAVLDNVPEETQQEAKISENLEKKIKEEVVEQEIYTTKSGRKYKTVAIIKIPKINLEYAVIAEPNGKVSDEAMEELLKISPCKFHGPEPNEVGNYCIVGHNYRNKKFFSKVPTLENGDIIELTNVQTGVTLRYSVYDKHMVKEDNVNDTTQKTNGKKEVTLITCTNESNNERWIIKATEVL